MKEENKKFRGEIEGEFALELQERVSLAFQNNEKVFIGISGISLAGKTTFTKQLLCFFQNNEQTKDFEASIISIEEKNEQIKQSLSMPFNQAKHYYENCYDTQQLFQKLIQLREYSPGKKQIFITEGLLLFKNTLITLFPFDIRIWVDCTFTTANQRTSNQSSENSSSSKEFHDFTNWVSRIHFSIDNPKNSSHIIYLNDSTLLRSEQEYINLQHDSETFFQKMSWLSPPPYSSILSLSNQTDDNILQEKKLLYIKTEKQSDYWQRTHYGFQNDNAHLLYIELSTDFTLYCKVSFKAKHQFDQSGLCVRIDGDNWLKTSIEFELNNPPKLGVVVTNLGYSDWSVQELNNNNNNRNNNNICGDQSLINIDRLTNDYLESLECVEFRIEREDNDYKIESKLRGDKEWRLMRICHLHHPSQTVKCGIYSCSPIGEGYQVFFHDIIIREKFF